MSTNDPNIYTQYEWLTAFQVGAMHGVSTDEAIAMMEEGVLPPPRVTKPLRWHLDDLATWEPPAWWKDQQGTKNE